MRKLHRIFIDVSFTRTQSGVVGITRTVQRLLTCMQSQQRCSGVEVLPVVYHPKGFRYADSALNKSGDSSVVSKKKDELSTSKVLLAAFHRWVTEGPLRRLLLWILPLQLAYIAWSIHSHIVFRLLAKNNKNITYQTGDLVFLPDASWSYHVWLAARHARQQGAFVVLLVHDLIPINHRQFCSPLFSYIFSSWLEKILKNCDAVICNSVHTKNEVAEWMVANNIPEMPLSNFRLGADEKSLAGTPIRKSIEQLIVKLGSYFCSVGSFEHRKNYPWLLNVFEQMWARGFSCGLFLVGRLNSDLKEFTDQLPFHPQWGKRLWVVHDANDAELDLIYRSSIAAIFPSLAEGFGLPLLEARARGLRVVASDIPAFIENSDEYVEYYRQGSVSSCAEKIEKVYGQRDGRPSSISTCSWENSAASCLKQLQQFYSTCEL